MSAASRANGGTSGASGISSVSGCGTALVTPMRGDEVDFAALERLCERQIEQGADFLVPCGTTGESPTLTDDERIAVIEKTVEAAAGRVPVVAGTGTNDTHHSVAMTKAARRAGAVACLAVAPYYNRPTQAGMARHFRAMIDDGGLPAMLYHIPGRSVVSIDVETVARVAEGGGVIGIKETGSVDRVTRLREEAGVLVFCGDDALTLPMIALGAVGVVSVASNVAPSLVSMLVSRARDDRFREARLLHDTLSPLFRALFLEPNPVPVKAALVIAGVLETDDVRLPLTTATEPVRKALREALRHADTAKVEAL